MNNFQNSLIEKFKEKKKLNESSILFYLRNLKQLADDKNFKNLNFLKDTSKIEEKLKDMNLNTKRNYLITICSSLNVLDMKTLKKVYDKYYEELKKLNNTLKAQEANGEPTEKLKKNYIEWSDVEDKYEELKNKVMKFKNKKKIDKEDYDLLQKYVLLSFYVLLPPRRAEYRILNVIKGYLPLDKNINYFNLDDGKIYFNNYKTAKVEKEKNGGKNLVIDAPKELIDNMKLLIKFHPLINDKKKINESVFVYQDGTPYSKNINSIYYLLKQIFGKNISATVLRHSYLSKYQKIKDEMQKDAKLMSHSVEMQKDYIKKI